MKNFRVTKCLDKGMIKEFVVFEDGSEKKPVYIHEKYGKYFNVDNELNKDEPIPLLNRIFNGRIKDAVETIKSGNGDCIQHSDFFGNQLNVLYFLDRGIGEGLRRKFLEGWKDAEFGWKVQSGNKNSFGEYCTIDKRGRKIFLLEEETNDMYFDKKEDAEKFVNDLLERSKYYTEHLIEKMNGVVEREDRLKVIGLVFEEMEKETGSRINVLKDFVGDMYENKTNRLQDYGYRVVQCVKH